MMKGEKGFSFVEVVISVAVLGIIAVGFIGGLGTASKGLLTTDERETANNLAEAQMEYVKNLPYSVSYSKSTAILNEYDYYDVDIVTTALEDGNIQKVVVTVSHQTKPEVIILQDYKVNR
jgi:prepilin-type N-terminal cleavage/methylation domain-containing protein